MSTDRQRLLPSPLGDILLQARDGRLVGLWFMGQAHFGRLSGPALPLPGSASDPHALEAAADWLGRYFRGEEPGPLPPISLCGTPFQQRVWTALLAIPRGEVRSYGQLAAALSSSPRAVGGAVARNPISILVPCHRVVGAGGLTGYAGGLDKKQALLSLERGESRRI